MVLTIVLSSLLTFVALVAVVLTLLVGFVFRKQRSWLMSYVQNFCGALFIVSGFVKAVDPLGTAYKLTDYFNEFQTTFEGTWFSFISPMFPMLANFNVGISVSVIIFEIILGLMLIMGVRPKWTAWAFLLLVGFFTALTGFTFLTGYVPEGVNFFEFSKWGAFSENNMKVKDCGCFGDFIKLVPKTSFLKDVALMVPALYFLFASKKMHQIFTKPIRTGVLGVSLIGLFIYCFSNYVWDLPHADFRPFKKGADVRAVREAEEESAAGVEILEWILEHKETGESLSVPYAEYMADYATKYKGVYSVVDQIKSAPSIKPTKISEFGLEDLRGNELTDDILYGENTHFMIVNYELKGDPVRKTRMVKDSVFTIDSVMTFDADTYKETISIVKKFDKIVEKEVDYTDPNWDSGYITTHKEKLKPFTDAAKAAGIPVRMVIGKSDPDAIKDFDNTTGLGLDYAMADDILLKTIVRSNPGVVLWKDGKILDKWHIKKLPDFSEVKSEHIK